MTTTYDWRDPKVGDVVYPGYTPAKAGKIVTVQGERVTVRQPNGQEYGSYADHLKCLRSLVSDHKRKLKTHEKKLEEIEEAEA